MNYYETIKNKIIDNEVYDRVKNYSKEKHKVETYFTIGRLLYELYAKYGDIIIDRYSERLMEQVNSKYNKKLLLKMKRFYEIFKIDELLSFKTQLSWGHYKLLIKLDDLEKICYYTNIAINFNLTVSDLSKLIKSNEYDELDEETRQKLINYEKLKIDADSEMFAEYSYGFNKILDDILKSDI